MSEYRFSPQAEEDLRDIWRSIAPDNVPAADKLLRRLLDLAELAATQPDMGVARPELSPTARLLIEGNYLVIYEPTPDGIWVIRVVYGGRDLSTWLTS